MDQISLPDKHSATIMNLKEARILLKKINSLFESIDYEGSSVSKIERDLMMNYLQQLNGLFSYDADQSRSLGPRNQPESRTLSDEKAKREQEPPRKEAPVPKPDTDRPSISKRLITDYPPARQQEEERPTPPPPREERPAPTPFSATPAQPTTNSSGESDSDLSVDQLFEVRQASDLSEKLSESPVNDLNRAMSINDRLLYMNELFGRDMESLNTALRTLNDFGTMSSARPFLIDLAKRYHWTHEDRAEIAKNFIKLVRRRYQ